MDKHLQNVCNLKVRTVSYMIHLKEAKSYKGVMELDEYCRSVLAAPQPSTSAPAQHESEKQVATDCDGDSSSSEATKMCPPSDGSESESDPAPSSSGSADYEPPVTTNIKYFSATSAKAP